MNLMVITNEKPIADKQKIKRKAPKHNAKDSHHSERKRGRK